MSPVSKPEKDVDNPDGGESDRNITANKREYADTI